MNLLLDHFEELTRRPALADKLKGLILQLAVQGKLVPQNPNDEPASELLKRIQGEKQGLVEAGEIRKEKPYPPISLEEVSYILPNGWEWVRLGEIGFTNVGLTYSPKEIADDGILVLRASNIKNGEISLIDIVRVNKRLNEKVLVNKGDLLICARSGSRKLVGKCSIIKELPEKMAFGAFMAIFRSQFNAFIKYFIESPVYRNRLEGVSTTTINQITQGNLKNTVIALPPLNEQKRIVAKVETLLAKVDAIVACAEKTRQTRIHFGSAALHQLSNGVSPGEFRQSWQRIAANFPQLFSDLENVKTLRQTILQLAVQGKLVPQDPNDEPASELLKRIQVEKQRLVDAGKIKKEKPLPPINIDDIPFELPEGWAWCKIGNLTKKLGAGSTPLGGKSVYVEDGIKFLRSQNVWNDGLKLNGVAYIPEKIHQKKNGTHVQAKDILLNITGASIGRCALVSENFDVANVSQHVAIVRMVDTDIRAFIHTFLISPYLQNMIMDVQVGISREGLSMSRLREFVTPLSPLNEQKRIVVKVEALMQLCDRLEAQINQSEQTAERLMDAVVQGIAGR